jgi:DNA helicase II / ATP-dependent DNA helicase PcrA
MEILEGLNAEQAAAARHGDGPMLVVAGAGTGKTRVIAHRIAALLREGKAKPAEVLALTFTEKAAREMEERLYDLIGWQSFQVPVMTFNAFGSELLGRFSSHIGRSVRGGLINDLQKALLLQQRIGEVEFTYYGPQTDIIEFIQGVVSYIGALQNAGVTAAEYQAYVEGLRKDPGDLHFREVDEQADLSLLYSLYEQVKAETGTYDYQDQIDLPLRILKERPNVAESLSKEYRYVLVDEYQDTNPAQDELLRLLVGRTGNLFAVGDDDQAIYGFRGADINNILTFAEHFEIAKPVVLTQNYRSGQPILDAAYRLIQHNDPDRLEQRLGLNKRLEGQSESGSAEFVSYETVLDEYSGVVERIAESLSAGEVSAEIGVLAATHAPLKSIAKLLRSREIPFAISTSASIFEQPELIGIWYLLKWVNGRADDEAVAHVMLGPFVGWTADQYRRLAASASESGIGIEEALAGDGSDAAIRVLEKITSWRESAKTLPVTRLVFEVVFGSGVAESWRLAAAENRRYVKVFEDLQRWFDQMADFEAVSADMSLRNYLKTFPQPPSLEVSEVSGDPDGVKLLTVHAAKGLEFNSVYLINCTARNWSRSTGSGRVIPAGLLKQAPPSPESEFRRLMYVAATRAKEKLEVSCPSKSMSGARQTLSPFVVELLGDVPQVSPVKRLLSGDVENAWRKIQQFYPLNNANNQPGKLPFETNDGWLELGVTSIARYEICPFEFYLSNVLQLPQPYGPQIAFGSALHKVFEAYNKASLGREEVDLEGLHRMLDETWSNRGYETPEIASKDRRLAHETLDNFVRREKDAGRHVLGAELPVRFELPEAKLRLKGKIDGIFQAEGGVELRDYKTGRAKFDVQKLREEAKKNFQLRTYALCYEALNGRQPGSVVLDYVVTGTEGNAELTPMILRNHREKLGAFAAKIRAREFAPNPSTFHRCPAVRYYGTGELDEILESVLTKGSTDDNER